MKKLFAIVVLGLLLQGCGGPPGNYSEYKDYWSQQGFNYAAKACSAKNLEKGSATDCYWYAAKSQSDANQKALNACEEAFSFCSLYKEGNRIVYNKGQAQQVKMALMIDKAKNTCKSLGFRQGTEKFTDCSLKIYTQEMQLAVKNNQQVVIQGQNSGTMTIYDPVRDSENMMRRGQSLLNGSCTLANYLSC